MSIAKLKQRPLYIHRQIYCRPFLHMPVVHIAAVRFGRNSPAHLTLLRCGRDAAEERTHRNLQLMLSERGGNRSLLSIDGVPPDFLSQRWIQERRIVCACECSKAGIVRADGIVPSRLKVENMDDHDIPRLSAFDVKRAGLWIISSNGCDVGRDVGWLFDGAVVAIFRPGFESCSGLESHHGRVATEGVLQLVLLRHIAHILA